jgi:hypothetical protein
LGPAPMSLAWKNIVSDPAEKADHDVLGTMVLLD